MSVLLDPLAAALAGRLRRELGIRGADDVLAPEQAPPERHRFAVDTIEDRTLATPAGPVPIRLYRPAGDALPVLVYLHGGGWFSGDLDSVDANCRELAARAGCAVVSVDYGLTPAHPFPHALRQTHGVLTQLATAPEDTGTDGRRIAVGGESAGGNLAAAACLLARDHGPRLVHQLLVYPLVDADPDRPELEGADDPVLSLGFLRAMWRNYLPDEAARRNPLAAPAAAQDLTGLPPALVVTAGSDPLRFEGADYARALARHGTPVDHVHLAGLFHGCFGLPHPEAEQAMATAVSTLREAFGQPV